MEELTTPDSAACPNSSYSPAITHHHSMDLPGVSGHQTPSLNGFARCLRPSHTITQCICQMSPAITHHHSMEIHEVRLTTPECAARPPSRCNSGITHHRSTGLPFGAADDVRVRRSTAFHILSCHQIPPLRRSSHCLLPLHTITPCSVCEWRPTTPERAARSPSNCYAAFTHHHLVDLPGVS